MARKKGIFTKTELENLLKKKNSCVALKNSVIDVYLMPYYLNDVVTGLWKALHKKLKAYDSKLEGILLGYTNIKVDLNLGRFSGRNAEIKYPVNCDCYVFQPSVGDLLQGKVNQMSSDHIGCIVHQFFNATIMRPANEPSADWNNRCIDYDEIITFRVKDLDYTGFIPYIEGELETYKSKSTKGRRGFFNSYTKDNEFQNITSRSNASLISSTQLPSTRNNSLSDSGLEFDIPSPIPQFKGESPKTPKSLQRDFDEDEDVKLIQNQSQDSGRKCLKRKYEISPGGKSAKKIKMTSDNDAGSSTRGSDNEKRKKKKSVFDLLTLTDKTSSKGNDSKIIKSSKSFDNKEVLKNKYETETALSPYSDAIESVIKKTTSASFSGSIDRVLNQSNSAVQNEVIETTKISKSVKKPKEKKTKEFDLPTKNSDMMSSVTADNTKNKQIRKSIPKMESEIISLSPYSDAIESVIKKTTSASFSGSIDRVLNQSNSAEQNEVIETTKIAKSVKKPKEKIKEFDLTTKDTDIISSVTTDNTKSNKIRKSNVKPILKKENEPISLSPYSDAIESVIKKTTSASFTDTIDRVLNQNNSAEQNEVIETTKIAKSVKKHKEKKIKEFDLTKDSDIISSVTADNTKSVKIKKSNVKPILKKENEPISLSPYSDAIESVIKKTTSTSFSDTIDRVLKQSNSAEQNEIIETINTVSSVKKTKGKKTKEFDSALTDNDKLSSATADNTKNKQIRKSNVNPIPKMENKIISLSPYSDAIESVIKQTNAVSYMDAIDSVIKQNICATPEESPSKKKKKKNMEQKGHSKIIAKEQNDLQLENPFSDVIKTYIKQGNSESKVSSSSTKKKMKTPVKQVAEPLNNSYKKISKKSSLKLENNEESEIKAVKNKKRVSLNLGQNSQITDTPSIGKKARKLKINEDPDEKMLTDYLNKMKEIAAKGGKQDLLLSLIKNLK